MPRSSRPTFECLGDRVLLAADLTVSVEPKIETVLPGAMVSYAVTVTNVGDAPATGAQLTHVFDGGSDLHWQRTNSFPNEIELAQLPSVNGSRLDGPSMNASLGDSVSSAGDTNGDGFDELLIGASSRASFDEQIGEVYLLLGSGDFDPSPDLSATLNANGGRVFRGPDVNSRVGSPSTIAGGGDFNADGFDDLVIGAAGAGPDGFRSGEVYVLYGSQAGFATEFNLLSLDGENGSRILGADPGDAAGSSVAVAGDVNGDGIDDLLIGAIGADPQDINRAGEVYVVFGSAGGFGIDLDLSSLDGIDGFVLFGSDANGQVGRIVSSAGDINGDGVDDILVGSSTTTSYVVLGSHQEFPDQIGLASLDTNQGFEVHAAGHLIESISAAGDVNDDGIDDLLFGVPTPIAFDAGGAAYVVFGRRAGFTGNVDLSELDGIDGFSITGTDLNDQLGTGVAGVGDINGDGVDDLAIGAPNATGSGPSSSFPAGEAYVIFGSPLGFAANFDIADLDGTNGFKINGTGADSRTAESLGTAGDVNGDGVADVLIGAPGASVALDFEGQAFVVFGRLGTTAGTDSIDGSLDLGPGESITYVVSVGVPTDAFDPLVLSANISLSPGQLDPTPFNNSITLTIPVSAYLPGDIDLDGQVAFADFLILAANFGRNGEDVRRSDGDFDGDHLVGFSDFLILAANFGTVAS